MIPDWLIEFEVAYTSEFEKKITDPSLIEFLKICRSDDWEGIREEASKKFQLTREPARKAFYLFWIVGSYEMNYDLELRARAQALWSEVENWSEVSYCRFLRLYQNALTSYFQSSMLEARHRLNLAIGAARSANYVHGEIRCLLHLGLVERATQNKTTALEYFAEADNLCKKVGSFRHERRLRFLRDDLTGDSPKQPEHIEFRTGVLEQYLTEHRFLEARNYTLRAQRQLRAQHRPRESENFYMYWPLILWGLNRPKLATRALSFVSDLASRYKIYLIKKDLFDFTSDEQREMQQLEAILGICQVVRSASQESEQARIGQVKIANIKNQAIQKFLLLLIERAQIVLKEEMAESIWNQPYDPLYHDEKIYRLVGQTRRAVGESDIIENVYGGYRLNRQRLNWQ